MIVFIDYGKSEGWGIVMVFAFRIIVGHSCLNGECISWPTVVCVFVVFVVWLSFHVLVYEDEVSAM